MAGRFSGKPAAKTDLRGFFRSMSFQLNAVNKHTRRSISGQAIGQEKRQANAHRPRRAELGRIEARIVLLDERDEAVVKDLVRDRGKSMERADDQRRQRAHLVSLLVEVQTVPKDGTDLVLPAYSADDRLPEVERRHVLFLADVEHGTRVVARGRLGPVELSRADLRGAHGRRDRRRGDKDNRC